MKKKMLIFVLVLFLCSFAIAAWRGAGFGLNLLINLNNALVGIPAPEATTLYEAKSNLVATIAEAEKVIEAAIPEPNKVSVFCDVCGESLTEWDFDGSRSTVTGVTFNVYDDHKEGRRVKKVFGKTKIKVCCVCFLKALGVKPKEVIKPNEACITSFDFENIDNPVSGVDYLSPDDPNCLVTVREFIFRTLTYNNEEVKGREANR